jgi:hypothetical protein
VNTTGAAIATVLAIILWRAPRSWAALALAASALYLPQQQAVDVFGVNVTAIRFLEVVGLVRVLASREWTAIRPNVIDRLLVLVYVYTAVVFLLRSNEHQAEMIGRLADTLLCYLVFRALVRTAEDFRWLLRAMVPLLLAYVGLLGLEVSSGRNPFEAMGAVTWDDLRNERVRAMGSFRNPSLLGTLGAALLPLYVALALSRRRRGTALAGIAASACIVLLANSGGPLAAAGMGIVGWMCWPARRQTRVVTGLLLAGIIFMGVLMEAPVWYLLERVSYLTGGSGWHRAHLLDMAARHFDSWWLAGMAVEQARDWFPYVLEATGTADITNNFLAFGLNAGVVAIALFVLLIARTFAAIGRAIARSNARPAGRADSHLLWALGCTLLVHVVTWMGITYFDQTYVLWLMELAATATIAGAQVSRQGAAAASARRQSATAQASTAETPERAPRASVPDAAVPR